MRSTLKESTSGGPTHTCGTNQRIPVDS